MFLNITLLEWLGYLGSVIVAVSLTMSSIVKLRWYNLLGAAVFSFYGFAIGSLPVGLLNLFIVFADIYYLIQLYSIKESFKSISISINDPYLRYFIEFHQNDISTFFPEFKIQKKDIDEKENNTMVLLLLRNAVVAGVFVGNIVDNKLNILLDYVIPAYRDCKPGEFVYIKNIQEFKNQGINEFACETNNLLHYKYLSKMGFVQNKDSSKLIKKL